MRYALILLLGLLFLSCGTYQISTTPKVKITKVLTITSTGDTLAVPLKQFQKYNYNNVFDNYRFNFGWSSWNYWGYPYYGWNSLYRPNSWYYRDFYYRPPVYNYSLELPIKPQKPRVYVNGRRGSNNIIVTPNGTRNNNNERIRIDNNNWNNRIVPRNNFNGSNNTLPRINTPSINNSRPPKPVVPSTNSSKPTIRGPRR